MIDENKIQEKQIFMMGGRLKRNSMKSFHH
jgi:hypothetical protein